MLLLLAAGVLGLVGWVLSLVALVFQYTYKNDFVSVDFASIWTTTTSKEDIDGAYRFGATCIFLIVLFGLCVVLASFAGAFNAAKANADTNGIGRATTVGYILLLILACLSYTYRAASKTNLDWGPSLDNCTRNLQRQRTLSAATPRLCSHARPHTCSWLACSIGSLARRPDACRAPHVLLQWPLERREPQR